MRNMWSELVKFYVKRACFMLVIIVNLSMFTSCNNSHINYVEQDLSDGKFEQADILNGVGKGEWVYYTGDFNNNLYSIKTDGKYKKLLKIAKAEIIDVADGWIYYNDLNKSAIYKIRTNGKDCKLLFGGKRQKGYCARGFKIIDGWIYFIDWFGMYEIYRVNLNGSNVEQISVGTYGRIFESNGWIYYIDNSTRNLSRVKIDGTNNEKLNDTNTRDFCIDGKTVYYCNSSTEGDGNVYRISISGKDKKLVIEDTVDEICYSNGWLIFTSGCIYKARIDGSDITKLQGDGHIEVHGKWIYFWAGHEHNQIIGRIDMDGNMN